MIKLKTPFATLIMMMVAEAAFCAAQAPAAAATSPVPAPAAHTASFEVADVHASPHVLRPFMDGGELHGDRYVIHQATMADLIATAFNLDAANVQGGPNWLEWDRFEIVAKAPPATSKADQRLMLQSLLKERFNLVTHEGTAPMPAYVMKAPSGKVKMKEAQGAEGEGRCDPQPPPANQAAGAIRQIVVICKN